MGHVLAGRPRRRPGRAPRRESARPRTLDRALDGGDFVFSAIRVGGLEGRTVDERLALGPRAARAGDDGRGWRRLRAAQRAGRAATSPDACRPLAPDAWVINFTNPAGLVTQAMQTVLGDRVVGICDSPLGLARRAAGALGHDLADLEIDYAGLNHLGWLSGLRLDGRDLLPDLLADAGDAGESIEEGHLFGTDWLQSLGMLPNEYLYYYYFTRDAIAQIRSAAETRGEFLLGAAGRASMRPWTIHRAGAFDRWDAVRRERNATYMQETRDADGRRVRAAGGGGRRGRRLRGGRPRPHGGDRPRRAGAG